MNVKWRLRMAAAQREIWTGAQLRRALAERAGLELSAASISALMTKQPAQLKLSTLGAICTVLEVDITPVEAKPKPARTTRTPAKAARGRSMPPL
jgi:DNA-binding Xre family transcriptional regulator